MINSNQNLINLCSNLISIESITPSNNKVIEFTKNYLENLGFKCFEITSKTTNNLYCEIGEGNKNICFAGHLDVVREGSGWTFPPFQATLKNDNIYGRGAVDMKGAIAAAIIAGVNFSKLKKGKFSLMLVGDEEDGNNYGTEEILKWLDKQNINLDYVIVGEPTNPEKLGQMVKIGRRGSISFIVKIKGKQGHVAHPENTINPIKYAAKIINGFYTSQIDNGNEHFIPSNLEVTNINVGNLSRNVIPGVCELFFNIRYSLLQNEQSLVTYVTKIIEENIGEASYDIEYNNSALPFISFNEKLINAVTEVIEEIHGDKPRVAAIGGTSDARFIQKYFPVIEYGLSFKLAHHADEFVSLEELHQLCLTYEKIFNRLSNF
ncbi:MAG: succinyl-diaminopimelate desuccinylase [Sphingobacteriia bacterium]|nr:succinyl-diaminopimelate desuccinylase [Sphingobacteriia bacterium]